MAELVSFESATEKQKLREIRKKERSHILKEVSTIRLRMRARLLYLRMRARLLYFVSLRSDKRLVKFLQQVMCFCIAGGSRA